MAGFLGRGWKFPVEVDPATGKILMSEAEDDIAESIRIILWTAKGERIMRSDFGCGVQNFMFSLSDTTTFRLLKTNIEEAIRIWEPRVNDVDVEVQPDDSNPGRLNMRVTYRVRSTNNLFNQVYPFYINEGTK